ncbi:MAG: beta-galactosidase, partial [Acidobacteriales bacterium]|nr:beta-galactosidase [Terriglobales bacterium]
SFVARPPQHSWWDYEIIMWQDHTAAENAVLKTLGISAGGHNGKVKSLPEPLLKNDLRWYEENVTTDFFSVYHRWFPDREVQWKFHEAKEFYKKDPSSKEAFKRLPSLSAPAWLQEIRNRLAARVRMNSPYRPLFYNLGDEAGIADLAAFWDYDFSDYSLTGMRAWLQQQYGTLAALNEQWGTAFTSWERVMPMTTNEAMKRSDDNFSAWGDFKEWMDISFARAISVGVEAVRSTDPEALTGIEGGQVPGWGGYDYAKLAKVLPAMEPYDSGANVEILKSLNPGIVTMITSGGSGPREKRRMWYEVLHGNRGIIVWDPNSEVVTKEAKPGPRGQESGPLYNELRSGIGALLIASERQTGPIAIHYSQATMRVRWLLERRPEGEAWMERTSASEDGSNFHTLLESYCRVIEDLGLQYRFVSYDQVEQDELQRGGYRVMILPNSVALSPLEAAALRRFVEQGGVLIADGEPGTFDAHNRRLPKPLLADLFGGPHDGPVTSRSFGHGKAIHLNFEMLGYIRDRLQSKERDALRQMGRLFKESGVAADFGLTETSGEPAVGVELHTFRNGGVNIVGLLASAQLYVEDLGPPEVISNKRFEVPRTVLLTLPAESYLYDVRAGKFLGKKKQLSVELDPYEPAIYAVSSSAFPALVVSAPSRLERGQSGQLGMSFSGTTSAAVYVLHVDVMDPEGKTVSYYSGNVLAPGGKAGKILPLALNDRTGTWTVRVKDVLTGQARSTVIEVF